MFGLPENWRERPEYLTRRKRNVHEEDDGSSPLAQFFLLPVAHHLGEKHQVVIVDPHDVILLQNVLHVLRKSDIQRAVSLPPRGAVCLVFPR